MKVCGLLCTFVLHKHGSRAVAFYLFFFMEFGGFKGGGFFCLFACGLVFFFSLFTPETGSRLRLQLAGSVHMLL